MTRREPRSSRPHMPGYGLREATSGRGLLAWEWARERLEKSHNYWLSTAGPDGVPHSMPVWGIWVDDVFYFSTGRQSRKSRNLTANPRCVVATEAPAEPVVVQGLATEVMDRAVVARLSPVYKAKYDWELDPELGPVYAVEPRVAFGLVEGQMTETATRWVFDENRAQPAARAQE